MLTNKGFTLIELLIVVAIIGILASVSMSSYRSHVLKANRIDAQLAINEMAIIAERLYARQNAYPADEDATGVDLPTSYDFTLVTSTSSAGADLFTITAIPIDDQADEDCGTLTLDQTGNYTSNDNDSCW